MLDGDTMTVDEFVEMFCNLEDPELKKRNSTDE